MAAKIVSEAASFAFSYGGASLTGVQGAATQLRHWPNREYFS